MGTAAILGTDLCHWGGSLNLCNVNQPLRSKIILTSENLHHDSWFLVFQRSWFTIHWTLRLLRDRYFCPTDWLKLIPVAVTRSFPFSHCTIEQTENRSFEDYTLHSSQWDQFPYLITYIRSIIQYNIKDSIQIHFDYSESGTVSINSSFHCFLRYHWNNVF